MALLNPKNPLRILVRRIRYYLYNYKERHALINRDFTIIANNCWGWKVYNQLGMPYRTPFIGLHINGPCFIKLLKNLPYYLQQELTFVYCSKYDDKKYSYPIALLGNDIEIHFVHYDSEDHARGTWQRRVKRINWDNLFIKMCDGYYATPELIKEFDTLDFENTVCFTAKPYPSLTSCVWAKRDKSRPCVDRDFNFYKYYFSAVKWLNG